MNYLLPHAPHVAAQEPAVHRCASSQRPAGREGALAEQVAPPFPRPHPGRGLDTCRRSSPVIAADQRGAVVSLESCRARQSRAASRSRSAGMVSLATSISSRSRSTWPLAVPPGGHHDLSDGLGSSDYPLRTRVGNHSGCESHTSGGTAATHAIASVRLTCVRQARVRHALPLQGRGSLFTSAATRRRLGTDRDARRFGRASYPWGVNCPPCMIIKHRSRSDGCWSPLLRVTGRRFRAGERRGAAAATPRAQPERVGEDGYEPGCVIIAVWWDAMG